VVKENATATEYQATLRVPSSIGPGYSPLHVFSAISGYEAIYPAAVYFGGKYEWDFTAENGWRIKLHPAGDAFPTEGSAPVVKYTAEFYRGNEPKPFEVREFGLGLGGTLHGNSYSGGLTQPASASGGSQGDDMQKLMQKLMDPNTTAQERQELAKRMQDFQRQMVQQGQSMVQQSQEDVKFHCENMNFSGNADPIEGQVSCGPDGTLKIKGTRRFVGP